jgi:hypothetical protein
MALSNWDVIAWGPDGACTKGYFNPMTGVVIEIYKNYATILLGDNHLSISGKAHLNLINNDTTISIRVNDENVPQEGMFIYCSCFDARTRTRENFGAIGCYGFTDTISLVLDDYGIDKAEGDYWVHGTSHDPDLPTEHFVESLGNGEKWRIVFYREGVDDESILKKYEGWVGVLPETIEKYFQWLNENEYMMPEQNDWVQKIKASEQLRYNQGDQYFAAKVGMHFDDIATTPAHCKEPVMVSIIKNLNTTENAS